MSHSIFESTTNKQTISIVEEIDDVFFEFEDDFEYTICIDEFIHTSVDTGNQLYGTNFVYPSEYDKRVGRLPGYGNNWKLGFIVTLTCENTAYMDDLPILQYNIDNAGSRKNRVPRKRQLESYKRAILSDRNRMDKIISSRINSIRMRMPKEVFLLGVKNSSSSVPENYTYEFAIIYKEYKD